MKRTLSLFFFILCCGVFAQAHNHPLFLTQGQGLAGYTFYTSMGQESFMTLDAENGVARKLLVTVGSGDGTTPWAGDALSFEYAIFDGISLGATTSGPQMLGLWGLLGGNWVIEGIISSSFDLSALILSERSNHRLFGLFLNLDAALDPVYSNHGWGFGLTTFLSTLSLNWRGMDTKALAVIPYLDFKAKFNKANPFYPKDWLTPANYADIPDQLGYVKASDYSCSISYASYYLVAAGVDIIAFEHYLFYVGLNFPIASVSYDTSNNPIFWSLGPNLNTLFDIRHWEFEFKYLL
jgi:hypothetical protein